MATAKIISFTDLEAWQATHEYRVAVLKLSATFPSQHKFGLTSQLQRSVISIGSNIAEGFGRQGRQEKLQFYRIARGSLVESQDQLIVARDIGLISQGQFQDLANQSIRAHKLINGLLRSLLRTTSSELRFPKT